MGPTRLPMGPIRFPVGPSGGPVGPVHGPVGPSPIASGPCWWKGGPGSAGVPPAPHEAVEETELPTVGAAVVSGGVLATGAAPGRRDAGAPRLRVIPPHRLPLQPRLADL